MSLPMWYDFWCYLGLVAETNPENSISGCTRTSPTTLFTMRTNYVHLVEFSKILLVFPEFPESNRQKPPGVRIAHSASERAARFAMLVHSGAQEINWLLFATTEAGVALTVGMPKYSLLWLNRIHRIMSRRARGLLPLRLEGRIDYLPLAG